MGTQESANRDPAPEIQTAFDRIEQAVTETIRTTELPTVHYGACQAVGRYCLSTLWKLSKDLPGSGLKQQLRKLIRPALEAMHKEWQNWGWT
jgi:hypothetical protein